MADEQSHKNHRQPRAGRKHDKKETADKKRRGLSNEKHNPRAFTFSGHGTKMSKTARHGLEKNERRTSAMISQINSDAAPAAAVAARSINATAAAASRLPLAALCSPW